MWDYGRLALIQKEDQGYVWYNCNFSKGQLLHTDFSNNHFVNCDTDLDNSNINTVMSCPGIFSESKPCSYFRWTEMFYGSRQTSEEGRASQEGGMNAAETVEFPTVKSKVSILLHALCM